MAPTTSWSAEVSAAVAYFSSGGTGRTCRHLADRRFCRAARDSFIRLTVTLTTSHVTFACSFHWLFARGVAVSHREDEWSHVAMLEGAGSVIPCLTSLLEGTGREVLGHVSRRCCNVGRDGKCSAMSHVVAAMLERTGNVRACLTSLLQCWKRQEVLGHVSRRCCNVGRDGKC